MSKTSLAIGVAAAAVFIGVVAWWLRGEDPFRPANPDEASVVAESTPSEEGETEVAEDPLPPLEVELTDPVRASVPVDESLPGAVYVLLGPEEQPIPDARFLLCQEGDVLARGRTDEAGELATEESRDELARLLVLPPGVAPQVHEVSLAAGRHEVRLDFGVVVSGTIVVDGDQPSERIPLQLRSNRAYFHTEDELGITYSELNLEGRAERIARCLAELDGSFLFYGLASDWSGELWLPPDYRLVDPALASSEYLPYSLRLEEPRQDVRVEVVKGLALFGRVVDLESGSPVGVPNVMVQPRLEYADVDPFQIVFSTDQTDERGRFRVAVESPSITGGYLLVDPPDLDFERWIEIEPIELHGDWDIGDLPLFDPRGTVELHLLVRETDGTPIAGAMAVVDTSSPSSEPTDAEGRTSLRGVEPGVSQIAVYAAGYEVVEVDVPPEPPDELVVTLPRGTLLELRFRTPDGEPAGSVEARLSAAAFPYRTDRPIRSYQAYRQAGCSYYSRPTAPTDEFVVRLNALREGRVVLNDLVPGLPLRLRVDGPFGTAIQEQDIAPLRPEEHRTVEVDLPRGPRSLRIRVLDTAGNPLPQASVTVRWSPPDYPRSLRSLGGGVSEEGERVFSTIYAETVSLSVEAERHASIREDDLEIPDDDSFVEFRLAGAHMVTVTIEDEEGRPVAGKVRSWLPSGELSAGRETPGRTGVYLLRDLPDEEITISVRVHGVSYEKTHDPRIRQLRFVVPLLGGIEATIRRTSNVELDDDCHLWLLPRGDASLVRRPVLPDVASTENLHLSDVLPGEYEAVVRRFLRGEFPDDAWFNELDASYFEELTPRVPLVVRAGETTWIEVEL